MNKRLEQISPLRNQLFDNAESQLLKSLKKSLGMSTDRSIVASLNRHRSIRKNNTPQLRADGGLARLVSQKKVPTYSYSLVCINIRRIVYLFKQAVSPTPVVVSLRYLPSRAKRKRERKRCSIHHDTLAFTVPRQAENISASSTTHRTGTYSANCLQTRSQESRSIPGF